MHSVGVLYRDFPRYLGSRRGSLSLTHCPSQVNPEHILVTLNKHLDFGLVPWTSELSTVTLELFTWSWYSFKWDLGPLESLFSPNGYSSSSPPYFIPGGVVEAVVVTVVVVVVVVDVVVVDVKVVVVVVVAPIVVPGVLMSISTEYFCHLLERKMLLHC